MSLRSTRHALQAIVLATSCLALCVASQATSADSWTSSPVTGITTYTAATGSQAAIIFISTPLPAGTEGCTLNPMNVIYLDLSDLQAKSVYASLLTAWVSQQPVTIGVRGCSSDKAEPLLYSIHLGS